MTNPLKNNTYETWLNQSFSIDTQAYKTQVNSDKFGELALYKYIDDPNRDADIATAADLKHAVDYFNDNNVENVILHYGHYFNADYDALFSLLHYFTQWFSGKIIAFSPEEIVFLSIVGNKSVDDVIEDLKKEGISHTLGFLPDTIFNSKFYADDDELFIDDRHVVFEKLIKNDISFIYPFNLGQIETEDEFEDMIQFIHKHHLTEIILQPNRVIDATEDFNYEAGQQLLTSLYDQFYLPQRSLNSLKQFLTDKSFEILFKFKHI